MKLKESIRVLLEYAGHYSAGPGTGISREVTHADRKLMAIAAKRAFEYAQNRKPDYNDLRNLGYFPDYSDK